MSEGLPVLTIQMMLALNPGSLHIHYSDATLAGNAKVLVAIERRRRQHLQKGESFFLCIIRMPFP